QSQTNQPTGQCSRHEIGKDHHHQPTNHMRWSTHLPSIRKEDESNTTHNKGDKQRGWVKVHLVSSFPLNPQFSSREQGYHPPFPSFEPGLRIPLPHGSLHTQLSTLDPMDPAGPAPHPQFVTLRVLWRWDHLASLPLPNRS